MKAFNRKKYNNSKSTMQSPFWKVIGLGLLAGMRTFSAPVIANAILQKRLSREQSNSPLRYLQSNKVGYGLWLLAAGELVGDKLPNTPNRIAAPGLIGRFLSGALTGAGIYRASGNNGFTGAVIGSTAALVSSFGFFYLRRFAAAKTDIQDPIIGGIEDMIVAAAGAGLIIAA